MTWGWKTLSNKENYMALCKRQYLRNFEFGFKISDMKRFLLYNLQDFWLL